MRACRSMRISIPARSSDQELWYKVSNGRETIIKIYKRHRPDRANTKNMSRNKPHPQTKRAIVCVPLGYSIIYWLNLHMRKWQPGPGGLQQLGRGVLGWDWKRQLCTSTSLNKVLF